MMNITTLRLTLLTTVIATLSTACAPVPPAPQAPYTPPPVTTPPYTPPITTLPNPTPPIANPGPAVPQQRFVVQLTASSSQSKAEGIRNTFSAKGYNAFVSPLMVNGRQLHRVQIGYYTSKADADAALAQMRQQYPNDVYVMDAVVKTP